MNRDEMMELAERCEVATGPDREIDALIWCALNRKRYVGHNPAYAPYGREAAETQVEFTEPPKRTRCVSGARGLSHAQPWTASLDAAMTLVPEGWFTFLAGEDRHSKAARWSWHLRGGYGWNAKCRAATPALALCAAALKARTRAKETPDAE